jgi:hypothetical protein
MVSMNSQETFVVDSKGSIWSQKNGVRVSLNVNMFHHNDGLLLRGRYERTGFGMTEQEKRAAISLGMFEVK